MKYKCVCEHKWEIELTDEEVKETYKIGKPLCPDCGKAMQPEK